MENRIAVLEEKQQEMIEAIMEINTNIASIGISTTESIKAIMEGFQNVNNAMYDIIQNHTILEERIAEIERRVSALPFNNN